MYFLFYHFTLASEFRSWTLFYGVSVLKGILQISYYEHFLLFSEALWLLLQSTVTHTDLRRAERLLQIFCFKFGSYYGECLCRYIHVCTFVHTVHVPYTAPNLS